MTRDEILNEIVRERNVLAINLDDSMNQTIRFNTNRLTNQIVDIFHEHLGNINVSRIEEMIEDEYTRSLHQLMRTQISKMSSKLDEAILYIMHNGKEKSSFEVESIFTMLTNEIARSQNVNFMEDLNDSLLSVINSSIIRNEALENLIGENALYDLASNIKADTRSYLNRYSDDILMDYQQELANQMQYFRSKSIDLLRQEKKEEKRTLATMADIRKINTVAQLAGLKFEATFDGVKVSDKKSFINSNLYKLPDGTLVSENSDLSISYVDGKTTITSKNNIFSFNGKSFTMGTIDNPDKIRVDHIDKKYQVYYGGELVTDPIKRYLVMDNIKRKYPNFYERSLNNSIFANMINSDIEKERESTEILVGENGITKINPQHREKYIEKMNILGFQVIENENGISIVGKDGKEIPIKDDGYIRLGTNKDVISTNVYYVLDRSIRGPLITYDTSEFKFVTSTDYENMQIIVGNYKYSMKLDSDGTIKTNISNIRTKETINNEPLIGQVFQHYMPAAFQKFADVYYRKVNENKVVSQEPLPEDLEDQVQEQVSETTMKQPEIKEERKEQIPTSSTEEKEEIKEILEELDETRVQEENQEEVANMLDELEEKKAEQPIQMENTPNIDEEIMALAQDPKVQRYIQLMQMQAEMVSMNQVTAMSM